MAATKRVELHEWLSKRGRSAGSAYLLRGSEKAGAIALDTPQIFLEDTGEIVIPSVDTTKMSATAVISTINQDRSRDIVEPMGCDLTNYARNPVVFFDHAYSLSLPVGVSEDPNKTLAVEVYTDRIEATCWFSQKLREAQQVFELVAEKIIRATSIGFRPLNNPDAVAYLPAGGSEYPGMHFKLWELLEWSWVGVPDNPEALAKKLAKPTLAGGAWSPVLLQAMQKHAPRPKGLVRGWTLKREGTKPMAKQNDPVAIQLDSKLFSSEAAERWLKSRGFAADELDVVGGMWVAKQKEYAGATETLAFQGEPGVKAVMLKTATPAKANYNPVNDQVKEGEEDEPKPEGEAPTEPPAAEPKAEGDNMPEEEGEELPEDEPEQAAPLGATVLESLHAALKDLAGQLTTAAAPLENPDVKATIEECMAALGEVTAKVQGCYESCYGDRGGLKMEDEGQEKRYSFEKFVQPVLKARAKKLDGLVSFLKVLAGDARIGKQFRCECLQHAASLKSALSGADLVSSEDQTNKILAKIDELHAKQKALQAEVKRNIPQGQPERQTTLGGLVS